MHKGTRRERRIAADEIKRGRWLNPCIVKEEEKLLFIKFYFHCLTLTKAREWMWRKLKTAIKLAHDESQRCHMLIFLLCVQFTCHYLVKDENAEWKFMLFKSNCRFDCHHSLKITHLLHDSFQQFLSPTLSFHYDCTIFLTPLCSAPKSSKSIEYEINEN